VEGQEVVQWQLQGGAGEADTGAGEADKHEHPNIGCMPHS
jgi:hypothetical protein